MYINYIELLKETDKLDLNLSTVYELLLPLASLWEQLGEALGLAPYLDRIKTNNHRDEQRLQAVLYQWENSTVRPYTWNTLIAALDSSSVGMKNLAAKMKESIHAATTLLWKPNTVCVWSHYLLIGKSQIVYQGFLFNRDVTTSQLPFGFYININCSVYFVYCSFVVTIILSYMHVSLSCEIQGYCNVCGYCMLLILELPDKSNCVYCQSSNLWQLLVSAWGICTV